MPPDPRVIELLLRYEELREQGQAVPLAELCRDCPELLDEVRRRVEDLTALQPRLDLPPTLEAPPFADQGPGEVPAAGTRFRPLRFHARGGLGEVFVADDTELHR